MRRAHVCLGLGLGAGLVWFAGCGGSPSGDGDDDDDTARDASVVGADPDAAPPAVDASPPRPDAAPSDPRFTDGLLTGPDWWLRTLRITAGSTGWNDLVIDPRNNIHVAGTGALDVNIAGGYEIYDPLLQSYDMDGRPLRRIGSIDVPGATWVSRLALGPSGELCMAGGQIAPGLYPSSHADPWARCLDAFGNTRFDWVRPSMYADSAGAVAIDASGAIVVAGYSRALDPYTHGFAARLGPTGQTIWLSDFDDGAHGDDLAHDIVAAAGGGFFVAGSSDTSSGPGKIFLRRYGADGQLAWSKAQGRLDGEQLTATPDGGVISYLFGAALVKYDGDGVERWRYRLPGPPSRIVSCVGVAAADDGTVRALMTDNGDSPQPGAHFLVTLSADGRELGRRDLTMLDRTTWPVGHLAVDHLGGVVITGGHFLPAGGSTEAFVLRLAGPGRLEP